MLVPAMSVSLAILTVLFIVEFIAIIACASMIIALFLIVHDFGFSSISSRSM